MGYFLKGVPLKPCADFAVVVGVKEVRLQNVLREVPPSIEVPPASSVGRAQDPNPRVAGPIMVLLFPCRSNACFFYVR